MKRFWLLFLVCLVSIVGCKKKKVVQERMCARVDFDRIRDLFPKNLKDLQAVSKQATFQMYQMIDCVSQVKAQDRTYQNSLMQYEHAIFQFLVAQNILKLLALAAQDESVRNQALVEYQNLYLYEGDKIWGSQPLTEMFEEYQKYGKDTLRKVNSVQYFLDAKLQYPSEEYLKEFEIIENFLLPLGEKIQLFDERLWDSIVDQRSIVDYSVSFEQRRKLIASYFNENIKIDEEKIAQYFALKTVLPAIL